MAEVRPRRIVWTSEGEVSIPTTLLATLFFVGMEKLIALVSLLPNDANCFSLGGDEDACDTCWYSGSLEVRKLTTVVNLMTRFVSGVLNGTLSSCA
jgi:hypothetical protein